MIADRGVVYRHRRLALVSLAVGVAGAVLWIIGLIADPRRALYGYLAAFGFVATTAVGALLFLQIGYAVNGKWVAVVRRLTEAVASTLTPALILFFPIALGAAWIYPWLDPPGDLSSHVLEGMHHREPYLNLPFFVARGVVFLAIWVVVAWVLGRYTRRTPPAEGSPEERLAGPRAVASATLPLVGLTFSFAVIDWLMTINPGWFSAIWGLYLFAGGLLAAISAVTIAAWGARGAGLGDLIGRYHFHALGRLLFGLTVLWAYMAFFQAMLIQIADLPAEVVFYIERTEGAWRWQAYALIIGHFVVPFAVLLLRWIKMIPRLMALAGAWQLVFHYIDIHWLVVPRADPGAGPSLLWLLVDLAALAALVGLVVAWAAWRQRGRPLMAIADPFLPQGLRYRSK